MAGEADRRQYRGACGPVVLVEGRGREVAAWYLGDAPGEDQP